MDDPSEAAQEAAQKTVDRLGINYDALPRLPFWAPISRKSEEWYKVRIASKVMSSSAVAGRQLTQPETDALSQHYASLLVTQAWDFPVVATSTIALYKGTYAKYGFPLWTPNPESFNPKKIPGLPESPMAPRIWHLSRLLAWYTGSKIVIGIFTSSYAVSVYMSKYLTDPTLADYRKDAKARVIQNAKNGQLGQPQARLRPPLPAREPAREETSSDWASTEQSAEQSAEQSTQDVQAPWPATQGTQPEASQDSFNVDDPYVFDEASPVAPTEQQRGASQQQKGASQQQRGASQQPSQGGSAWDRIRKQQPSGSPAPQASAWGRKREDELTSRGARDGSSFTYTAADEEKVYAKDQAQKEFDEMLEKERRGEASERR